ncbi:hypothetical protein QQS21_004316 [Conoideocrella luteorostrata]|uniref:Sacsin/Nov domain-containing protein n=1 Tax=Conoideocrella luteorostrata TaxID=1105319 RepID=A0AAJ0CRH7_9HYPO|nr:hypothetical protein QQS21_004316 [Conoideocrella luteorostrata]
MDYSSLRAAALRDGEDEEAVTVDTRALIDKVLARYSGEWTTLRELIQNAADAQATTVTVKWETIPSTQVPFPNTTSRSELLKHAIANHTMRRLVVQNDGQPFTKTDWGRLKRIAEGNPDETKIGAFGVGFYSVFADCEEPFVSSGSEAMAFYWKGNSLFTKKSQLPADKASRHTAFVLDYRNTTTPMPNLLSVSQFLATSLTFVALQNIEFWIDDYQILSLKKKSSPPADLSLPRDLEARTKEGLMKVIGVDCTSTQIDASYMSVIGWKPQATSTTKTSETYVSNEAPSLRSFFARLTASASQAGQRVKSQSEDNLAQPQIAEDVTKISSSSIFLSATSATVQTKVSSSFASELERATKKPPPKTTKISILTASYDEAGASEESATNTAFRKVTDVFASVLPSKKPGGRIFIGFPTMQTTGAGMHVSAPSVIPTVEREAIDLNARWVRTWNVELLRAAGIVSRLAFANEMSDLNKRVRSSVENGKRASSTAVSKHMPEALHTLKTFTFGDSTPSSQVGQIMEEAFWTCFKKASIEVFSSQGVLQTTQVRLGSDELNGFVESIPIVPEEMKGSPFIKKLIDFGLISHITVTDVKQELEAKALTKSQMIKFISWAGKKSLSGELDPGSRAALLEVAVATLSGEDSGEIIALGSITNYPSLSITPANVPLPPTTIPFSFTTSSHSSELQALGWEPLEVLPWFRYLVDTTNSRKEDESVTRSSKFAVQVLTILSKNWDTISNKDKISLASLTQSHPVMPTRLGMRRPGESFFPSVKLFDDLPIIQGCEKVKEKFLVAVGVRKTVDLETIFTRLLNDPGNGSRTKWSHMELIKYLASVHNDIPSDDLKKLRESKFCPAEAGPKGMASTQGSKKLYKVSELFEPKDSLRALDLPLLQWVGPPGSFRASSPEARFLSTLGLRVFPSAPELVEMMSAKDDTLRISAMTYFIANHHSNRYGAFDLSESQKPILPLQGSTQLVTPMACFTNERAAVLGFHILRRDLHDHANKFGVARDPPMVECVNKLLASPPQDQQSARTLFSYFASRITEVRENSLAKLRNALIVPVSRASISRSSKPGTSMSHISPCRSYLGASTTYGEIFDFVDFGQEANAFLFHCGAKSEPSKVEVAHMACNEPARLLSVLQSPEKYMDLLKSLAESSGVLHRDKDLWRKLRSSSCLLAYKELAPSSTGDLIDLEEDVAPIKQYQLASASQIVVLDDIISYRLFKEHLICAPEEDTLEAFYLQLGAQKLSSIVQEDVRIGPHTARQKTAEQLRKHVVERSKLFLYEYANYRRDAVKHDSKWLEKNLRVETVRSVALRRTLKGHRQSHTEKRSAAGAYEERAWVLYVADDGNPDMYQIGQAVCQMLLNRPNQQAYLFFEPFLTLDLFGLRARGYNVDRILRAKAAEARIAEEERRKALEEEQKRIQEREQTWAQQSKMTDGDKIRELPSAAEAARQVASTPEHSKPAMPGAWGSPDDSGLDNTQQPKKGGGLFSNLTRRLGFDSQDENKDDAKKQLEKFVDNTTSTETSSVRRPNSTARPQQDDGRVTSPAVVQQNLLNAVNATRAHGSDHVFSEPTVNEVKEQATYCDSTPAQNITFAAEASNSIKVYVARDMQTRAADFLSANIGRINTFAGLLVDIGDIYSLSPKVLHIFYDESGGTIAFNTGGSIFCNFRFFSQLHASQMHSGSGRAEASTWWWVVLAHELAHNLVSAHNSDHSYYTESFIQQYMVKMMSKYLIILPTRYDTTQNLRERVDTLTNFRSNSLTPTLSHLGDQLATMVHRIAFWSCFGLAVRFWQVGIEMRPFFNKSSLWAYPAYALGGASFGYWLQGVDDKQSAMLSERKAFLLEKRKRKVERENEEARGAASALQ